MNNPYWLLGIPLICLLAIFRGGKWNWNVVPRSRLINGLFWLGFITSIVVFTVEMIWLS